MGAKEELDDRIKAKIKPNGEGQISGQMMQNTLLDVNATNQKMYHPRGGDKLLDLVAKGITAIKGGFENLVAKQADIECIITPEIVSPEYTEGAFGKGLRYYIDEHGNAVLVLDKLRVMKEAMFNVLTVSELRSVGGQILLTYADARVEAVVEKQSAWRCYYDSGEGGQYWIVGDQARCQKFTGDSGESLKYYWRLVTAVGNEELGGMMLQWIELSKEVAEGEGVPQVGDQVVGLGHRGEDRRRKNAKLISAFGETGVEEISYANIDGFSLVGKETAYQSPERWRIASQRFELVAGDGIVYPIVVERGAWSEAQAPYYYYDRVSHGGNIYLCIDKRLDGTVVEPATDQHAVWLCEVRKGDTGAAAPRLKTQFSINGTTAWHDAYAVGDAYRRESNDNGATWSVAMRMVGEKGDSGADGKKTPYTDFSYAYGLSQPTVWLDAPPSKVEGQHLWERIQKYTPKDDNSGWTLASTRYAVISEFVQIGGRNLLRNTSSDWQISHGASNYWGDISQYRGKQMLVHFEYDNTDNQAVSYYELYINDVWRQGYSWSLDNSKIGVNYCQSSFIVPDDAETMRVVTLGAAGRFKSRRMMMEAGNKATDWAPAPEDVQAEIDNIQIGGVNLLSGSASAEGWIGYTTMENREFQVTRAYTSETYLCSPSITLDEATQYTLSFESKCDDSINGCEVFLLGYNEGDKISFSSGYEKSQGWIKQVMTFMPLQTNVIYPMRLRFDHNGSEAGVSASIWVRNIKLEKGNKATDWSPSPEDVQAEIDKANAVLADMASDSKLTPTEKQQTAVEWSRIKAEQAKNTAAATAAGVSTAEVTIAYNTLNGYLETGANPLLKDLTTTSDIVGSTFRSTFATWYDKNATLVNATAEAVARNAADAVQIGGVNLALNSKLNLSSNSYEIATVSLSEGLRDGQQVTITINGVLPEGKKYYIGTSPSSRQFITLSKADNGIYTGTGVFFISPSYPNDVRNKLMLFCYPEPGDLASKTDTVMVEKGNKRSDWQLAPQDVQAEIDKATSVVYSINPSAEQIKKIVTTDAKGIRRVELLPSLVSVTATIKRGNRDESVISSAPMEIYANNSSSITIQRGEINLNSEELYDEVREWWEWFDVILYNDTTYSKELARKRIHINENADISGAEIAARINASGSEVQIEGERISVIGKMISLNKMTVDVNGNATMNDVTMNNANVSGKVTASSGSIANMLEVSNNQLRSGDGMLNISQGKADATKPGLTRCDSTAGRVSIKVPGVSPNQTIKSGLIKLTNQTTGEFQFAVALQFRPTSGGSYNGMVSMGLYVNEKDAGQIATDLVIKGSSLSAYVPVAYRLGLLNSTIEISIKFQYAFNGMIDLCFNQSDNANSPVGIYYDNRDKNIFQEFGVMHKYGNGQLYLTSLSKDPKLVDESGAEAGMVVGGHGFIVRPSGVVRLRDGREAPANCSNSASTQVSMVLTNTTDHVTCWGDGAMNITLPINPALGHTIRIYSLKNTGSVRVHPNAGSHLIINGIGATFYDIPGGGYSIILTYDGGPWLGYRAINA